MAGGEFSLATLGSLMISSHSLVGVVSKPDRPKGRRHELVPMPAARWAMDNHIPLLRPARTSVSAFESEFRRWGADVVFVADFGEILKPVVLSWTEKGFFGVHPSLLPRWRGAAPVPRAILAGDQKTGVTLFKLTPGVDEGAVVARTECDIGQRQTAPSLLKQLASLGAELVVRFLSQLEKGTVVLMEQPSEGACMARKLSREDGLLNWQQDAQLLDRRVRALLPWPCAWFRAKGKAINVMKSYSMPLEPPARPGLFLGVRRFDPVGEGVVVGCGVGALLLLELQSPGKKTLAARDWVNGFRLKEGDLLE